MKLVHNGINFYASLYRYTGIKTYICYFITYIYTGINLYNGLYQHWALYRFEPVLNLISVYTGIVNPITNGYYSIY